MKIDIDKNLVNFTPENEAETSDLEKLWNYLVGCVTDSKKLTPVGEYSSTKKNVATFFIEGIDEKKKPELVIDKNIALEDGAYYCERCNKLIQLKAGDEIPLCCGLVMERVD